jgi:UDP:flavonoid glycosyltransferase YjiC (YdhE family)
VLVGLSTTFQDQQALLQRIVDALGRLPVRGLVTTGPAVDPQALRAGERVEVVRGVSHDVALDRADLVVTHAGHGTVIRALARGVPLVCIPMGRDQADTAARVVARGAGVRLPARASVARIATAVGRVLADPTYRANAGKLAEAIRADLAAARAIPELEDLVADDRS